MCIEIPMKWNSPARGLRRLTCQGLIVLLVLAAAPFSVGAETCGEPELRAGRPGDAANDAAGRGQIFESIVVPGFTDVYVDTSGIAIADLDRDGLLDILVVHSGYRTDSHTLKLLRNRGCLRFEEHPVRITGSEISASQLGAGVQIPNLVDFDGDGFLDILLTRSGLKTSGNTLLLSDGGFDRFVDRSTDLDVRNLTSYTRQSSIADVDGDGWLDVGVASDNIGDTRIGRPIQRLYLYRPDGEDFEDGSFSDIGGTGLVPGFGGEFAGDPRIDKAGPQLSLRDLDNDGDIDLVQGYACDMVFGDPTDPNASGMYDQGVWVWRNLLRETGEFRFERIVDNGLAEFAKMHYNAWENDYDVVVHGLGLPYMSFADVNNDGLLDAVATGATDPFWHVHSDQISGAFWYNLGDFRFKKATHEAGLGALNWSYGQWGEFWGAELPTIPEIPAPIRRMPSRMEGMTNLDVQGYGGDLVFGDFDNDGWQDLLWVDRHEIPPHWGFQRNALLMNNGDGTFRPVNADVSGIDDNSTSAEAADLNNDGLLDIVYLNTPGNTPSGVRLPDDRYADKVYWNTGAHGGADNHWLRVRFSGVSDHRLIGAHVFAYEAGTLEGPTPRLLGMRAIHSNQSYRTGCPLEAHFGLGTRDRVDLEVRLLSGEAKRYENLPADRIVDLDLGRGTSTLVPAATAASAGP
jgi:hypothetical protein